MKILFALRHSGYLRLFESTILELGRRGHEIRLVLTPPGRSRLDAMTTAIVARLDAEGSVSVCDWTASRAGESRRDPNLRLQLWLDYLRYLEPAFVDAPKLRERAGARLSPEIRAASERLAESPELLAIVRPALAVAERAAAAPRQDVRELVATEAPDLVLVTPLFDRTGTQTELVRAARAAGIAASFCCSSWDNLTTGGLIHADLDGVAVWNAAQRDEAVRLHGVQEERVAVTGAAAYDVWFHSEATCSRDEWCSRIGLDPSRPYLLYVCSSAFISGREAAYIARWAKRLRDSGDGDLRDAQVLVRPHPQNALQVARLRSLSDLSIHPVAGELPVDDDSRARYVNAIHHSAAVVGVNTSAMIESAIFDRGIHVHLSKQYRGTQLGTLHFRHLLAAGGGLLNATASIDEHHAGLRAALNGEDGAVMAERARAFLAAFVRPHGLDRPATPRLATAIEAVPDSAARGAAGDPFGIDPAAARVTDALMKLL